MKRLLFIINALGGGGAERALSVLLGSEIISGEFEIHLVLLENKIEYKLPEYVNLHIATNLGNSASKIQKAKSLPVMVRRVREIKEKVNPGVSVSFLTRSNIINILTRRGHERVFISERNNPLRTYSGSPLVKFIHKRLISYYYPRADEVLTVSDGVGKALISYICIDPGKVVTLNNPYHIEKIEKRSLENIEEQFRHIYSDCPVIITVGRLTRQKGHDCLLDALPPVLEKHPVKLGIIGEGELEASLKKKASDLNISDRVYFMGWRSNPFKFIRKAALFVLPSRWEGFPNALVEAMACGCPVVSTDCESGPSEIIQDNHYGLLTGVDNPEDLARAIIQMLDNKEKLKEFGRLAKERAAFFHKDRIGEKFIDIIMDG